MKKILIILGLIFLIGNGFSQENKLSEVKENIDLALQKALESAAAGDLNALALQFSNYMIATNAKLISLQTQLDNLGSVPTTNLSYTPSSISLSVDSTQDIQRLNEVFGNYTGTTQGGSGTTTWITTIPALAFAQDGDSVSIMFEVKTTAQDISGASIGQIASTGDLYDREAGTISAFRFSDYTGLTTGTYTSAKLAYAYDHTKAYNIMLSCTNAYVYKNTTGLGDQVLGYFKASGQGDSLTANVTGYSNALPNWTNIMKVTLYYSGSGGNVDSTVYILARNVGTGAIKIDSVAIGSIFDAGIFDDTLSPNDTSSIHITIPRTTVGGTYSSICKVYYNGSATPDNLSVSVNIVSPQTDPPVLVPPVPTGLTATAQTQAIKLDWTDVTNETRYRIFRSSSSGGTYTQIDSVNSNITTYTNTGLTGGSTWYYKIASYNSNGQSSLTTYVSATAQNVPVQTGSIFVSTTGTTGGAGTLADPKNISWFNSNKTNLHSLGYDTVYFKLGETWSKTVLDLSGVAGTPGQYIVIKGYGGNGNKPSFNYGDQLTGWTFDATSNLYRKSSTNYIDLFFQCSFDSVIRGVFKSSLASVTGRWDFRYENGYYYIKDPAYAQSIWVARDAGTGICRGNAGTKYVKLINIDFRYGTEYNLWWSKSKYNVIDGCNSYGSGNNARPDQETGFGFKFQGCDYSIIKNSNIRVSGAHGIDISVYHDLESDTSMGMKIWNNKLINCTYSFIDVMNSYGNFVSPPAYRSVLRDVTVSRNILIEDSDCPLYDAQGIQFQGRPTTNVLDPTGIYNNGISKIVADSNICSNLRFNFLYASWSIDSVTFRNNIGFGKRGITLSDESNGNPNRLFVATVTGNKFQCTSNADWHIWINNRTANTTCNNNQYYSSNGTWFWGISNQPTNGGTSNNTGSLATWRTNTGFDVNSTYGVMPFSNTVQSMRAYLGL